MKRITIDVQEDKAAFVLELLRNLKCVSVKDENIIDDDLIGEDMIGMYDAIVSLQQGKGIPN